MSLGFDAAWQREATRIDPSNPVARIARVDKGRVRVLPGDEPGVPLSLVVPPTLETLVVGDWVIHDADRVLHLLERRTLLRRRAAGRATVPQPIAANVDQVFVVQSMNRDFSTRRAERYVAAVRGSGAEAVLVLSKADLDFANQGRYVRQLEAVAAGAEVLVTSTVFDVGLDDLAERLSGRTSAFMGSSGVGKSTLINHVLGEERLETRALGVDERGKHTTTHRELIPLPGGGTLIDTPGLRELGVWEEDGVAAAFPEIEERIPYCGFNDCAHETEPNCAVLQAVEEGEIPESRLKSWRKLQRELAYNARRKEEKRRANRDFAKMIRNRKKIFGR